MIKNFINALALLMDNLNIHITKLLNLVEGFILNPKVLDINNILIYLQESYNDFDSSLYLELLKNSVLFFIFIYLTLVITLLYILFTKLMNKNKYVIQNDNKYAKIFFEADLFKFTIAPLGIVLTQLYNTFGLLAFTIISIIVLLLLIFINSQYFVDKLYELQQLVLEISNFFDKSLKTFSSSTKNIRYIDSVNLENLIIKQKIIELKKIKNYIFYIKIVKILKRG